MKYGERSGLYHSSCMVERTNGPLESIPLDGLVMLYVLYNVVASILYKQKITRSGIVKIDKKRLQGKINKNDR